jgi:hypothetical protein
MQQIMGRTLLGSASMQNIVSGTFTYEEGS